MKRLLGAFLAIVIVTSAQAQESEDQSVTARQEELKKQYRDNPTMQNFIRLNVIMEECMKKAPKGYMNVLVQKDDQASQAVDKLCAAGQTGRAELYRQRYIQSMQVDPVVADSMKCMQKHSEELQGMAHEPYMQSSMFEALGVEPKEPKKACE